MGRMFPRGQREAGRCVGAFGGSRDPLWGIGVVRGLEGHTFREIGGPVRIHRIVPEPDDGVVAEYRIEFVLAHLTRDEAGVVDGRCGGLRRIGQTGNGRVRGFPDFSHSAAAWRLPGLAAPPRCCGRSREPKPVRHLTNGAWPVTGRPVSSRSGDRWRGERGPPTASPACPMTTPLAGCLRILARASKLV